MFFILSIFWFIRTVKVILFWIYLWQLKEYHIGRFLDHFRTAKGKKILFQPLQFLKIILAGLFIFCIFTQGISAGFALLLILFLVYFIEALTAFNSFLGKRIKLPVLTSKTLVLIAAGILITGLFPVILSLFAKNIFWRVFWVLLFDIFAPLIISIIVFYFQPLAVMIKNKTLKKAKERRKEFKKLLVIGITGSYGKTSVKEFLAEILSKKFRVLKTEKHINAEIGIAETILKKLKPEHDIFIAEVGAYEKGKIKEVCDILLPKLGVLTGINEQHMATFGSQKNIIEGKYELIESLPEDGVAFFNAKNKYCVELYKKTKIKKYLYGENAKLFEEENLLGAIAVAKELGMTEEEISSISNGIKNNLSCIQQKKGVNGLTVLDATYSANPDGVISHLDYLKTLRQARGKLVIVMPCLIELGKASKEVHKRIGEKIGEICDLAIIVTKDKLKEIKDGSAGSPQEGKKTEVLFIENPREIFEKIKSFCSAGDIILLEGRLPKQLINFLVS